MSTDMDSGRRPTGGPMSRPPFEDIDKLSNAYNMVAVISQRMSNGVLTFAIFREFERDGKIARTNFIPEELGEVYLDFTRVVLARIAELKKGPLPFPVRAPA